VAQTAAFTTVAKTRNQYNTAAALDSLPQSGPALGLYNTLMYDAGTARSVRPAVRRSACGQPCGAAV
jgi:hypothetical protein